MNGFHCRVKKDQVQAGSWLTHLYFRSSALKSKRHTEGTIETEVNEAGHNWNNITTTANGRSGFRDHVAALGAEMPEDDNVRPCRSMVLSFFLSFINLKITYISSRFRSPGH